MILRRALGAVPARICGRTSSSIPLRRGRQFLVQGPAGVVVGDRDGLLADDVAVVRLGVMWWSVTPVSVSPLTSTQLTGQRPR